MIVTKKVSLLVLLFVLASSEVVCPEPSGLGSPGSVDRGWLASFGYDGSYVNLKGQPDSSVLDKDTGWQNGPGAGARFGAEKAWLRTLFACSRSNGTKYRRSLDGYTPVNVTIKEEFSQDGAALGHKLPDITASTLALFGSIDNRDRGWESGRDFLTGNVKLYTWYYFPGGGVNYVSTIEEDAAVQAPLSMTMRTGTGGPFATGKPSPSSRLVKRRRRPSGLRRSK